MSCNTAFAYLGLQIGADALQSQAAKFGFGDALEVPMRVTPSSVPAELNKPQLAQSSIGQYDVRVTPLQMAMVAAGVANRGVVMTPYLVESVIGSDLSVIESADPQELSQAVTPEVAAQLTRMMEAVVEDGTGTGAPRSTASTSPARPAPRSTARAARRTPGSSRSPRPTTRRSLSRSSPRTAVSRAARPAAARVAAPIAKQMMEARLNR